jgi:hypothetical protein
MHTFSGLRLAPTAPSCRYMMACYVSHSSRISTLILMITGGVRHHRRDGADSVSAELFRWHRLPIWLQPRAQQAAELMSSDSSPLPTRLREVVDSGVRGNRHVGLHHADFLSVNIVDGCYIMLPGFFTPVPSGRS